MCTIILQEGGAPLLPGAFEKMNNINGTYSDLLRDVMKNTDYSTIKELYDALIAGHSISYSSFVSYCNGTTCPIFSKAKLILELLGYHTNDSEISESLQRSKNTLREIGKDEKYIQHGVRLPVEEFEISKGMLERIIQMRAEELTGKSKSFNAYVCELIKNDLKESGML